MRVLVVPEVYRPDDLTSNGTVNDAAAWVREWLRLDDSLHVYWLLPPRERADYDPAAVHADRDRITLIEAETLAATDPRLTDDGYTAAQLRALREAIVECGAYVDVVVDQLRTGRPTLRKWLLAGTNHWAAQVDPFDVVANVHDLQVPSKYRYCPHRDAYQMRTALAAVAFADGAWFTAGVDAATFRAYAKTVLDDDVVAATMADAVEAGAPITFDAFDRSFADRPEWFHVAGSTWAKKDIDRVLAVAERLHDEYGIRTVLTSMDEVPHAVADRDWIDAHPDADRETYEAALTRGDLAVCASEYETMARTPFEQAASGQVLVLRDEPWIYDCVPDDYDLAAPADALAERTCAAVERWDAAVAETERMLDLVERVRAPEACGRRTYDDLRQRVDAKLATYDPDEAADAVERALENADGPVALDDLIARTAGVTPDGEPVIDRESVTRYDVVYALRSLGYEDSGNPGTPAFRP